jgi:hypothetical protein
MCSAKGYKNAVGRSYKTPKEKYKHQSGKRPYIRFYGGSGLIHCNH